MSPSILAFVFLLVADPAALACTLGDRLPSFDVQVAPWVQPVAQPGAVLAARSDARGTIGWLASIVGDGIGLRPAEWLTLSFDGMSNAPAASSFLRGHEIVSTDMLALQGGLGAAFRL